MLRDVTKPDLAGNSGDTGGFTVDNFEQTIVETIVPVSEGERDGLVDKGVPDFADKIKDPFIQLRDEY